MSDSVDDSITGGDTAYLEHSPGIGAGYEGHPYTVLCAFAPNDQMNSAKPTILTDQQIRELYVGIIASRMFSAVHLPAAPALTDYLLDGELETESIGIADAGRGLENTEQAVTADFYDFPSRLPDGLKRLRRPCA